MRNLSFLFLTLITTLGCAPADNKVSSPSASVDSPTPETPADPDAIPTVPALPSQPTAPDAAQPPPTAPLDFTIMPSNPRPVFSHDFTDRSLIREITPLGTPMSGDARGHVYVGIKLDVLRKPFLVPVYAPTRLRLERVNMSLNMKQQPEWFLTFRASAEVTLTFAHVTNVVPKISNLWQRPPATNSSDGISPMEPEIFFEAGEVITPGTRGNSDVGNFDFGVYNKMQRNEFANMARYFVDTSPHGFSRYVNAVCPLEYFAEPFKSDLWAKLGHMWAGGPVANIGCRSSNRDVVGTIAGSWFLKNPADSTSDYRTKIGITNEAGFVMFGGISASQVVYNPPQPAPETIQNEYCYSDRTRYVYVKLLSANELAVYYEPQSGVCPNSIPANYRVYER